MGGTKIAFRELIPNFGGGYATICFWQPVSNLFAFLSLQNPPQIIHADYSRVAEISLRLLWLHFNFIFTDTIDSIESIIIWRNESD